MATSSRNTLMWLDHFFLPGPMQRKASFNSNPALHLCQGTPSSSGQEKYLNCFMKIFYTDEFINNCMYIHYTYIPTQSNKNIVPNPMNSDAHNDSNISFTKLRENFVDVTSYLPIVKVT